MFSFSGQTFLRNKIEQIRGQVAQESEQGEQSVWCSEQDQTAATSEEATLWN